MTLPERQSAVLVAAASGQYALLITLTTLKVVLSQDDKPQTHRTQRQIAREMNISQTSVNRIVKLDLRLECLKKRRAHELTLTRQSSYGVCVFARV